jgi:predicted ATPase
VTGNTLYYLGEMTPAREHLDQAVALSGPGRGRALAIQAGQEDPAVTPFLRLAWVLWAQGFPDQAVERCLGALELARESSHSATMTAALVYLARVFQFRCEPNRVREHAEAALALASERGFAQRLAAAQILLGWARTELGLDGGFDTMIRGIDDFRSTGAGDDLPYWLALLATARGKAGQIDTALGDIAQGLEIVNGGGARVWEAELYRIKGELILRGRARGRPASSPAGEAEDCFQRALAIAHRQQARSLELRAALTLARAWSEAARHAEARDLLVPLHTWFTEGFDTPDLREARRLLDELLFRGHSVGPRGGARRRLAGRSRRQPQAPC